MEPPISFDADAVHDEQTKVLHAIQPLSPGDACSSTPCAASTARAQSTASRCPPIAPSRTWRLIRTTPTFVAMALHIDNWRWAGVPFYLRTGKRMSTVATQIVIRFRRPPFMLFRKTHVGELLPTKSSSISSRTRGFA